MGNDEKQSEQLAQGLSEGLGKIGDSLQEIAKSNMEIEEKKLNELAQGLSTGLEKVGDGFNEFAKFNVESTRRTSRLQLIGNMVTLLGVCVAMFTLFWTVKDFSSNLVTVVKETVEDTMQVDRSNLLQQTEVTDDLKEVTDDLKEIENLNTFTLRKNNSVSLKVSQEVKKSFGVGAIYAQHGYLYVGIEGERRQLYIGEHVEFGPRASPCNVTLVRINRDRQEGTFRFECVK